MLISHYFVLLLLIAVYRSSATNVLKLFNRNDRDSSRNRANVPLREFRPTVITDDIFKPKSFDAYVEMMKQKLQQLGGCAGYKSGNVKQMIKDGKLLSVPFYRTKKASVLPPLFPVRLRRSSNMNLKDEIESIKIYPIESNGTKTIECHKDTDEEISCRQDDFEYKIKLKHKDLSQESLENLIRTLYIRLSSSVPAEKRKRSETTAVAAASASLAQQNEAPFMIVLPPPEVKLGNSCQLLKKGPVTTDWPYLPCKTCDEEEDKVTFPPPIDQMVIECSPRDYESVDPNEPRVVLDETNPTTKQPSAFIYSCKWQGKRQIETENIVVPFRNNNNIRTSRQSFKIIIDPSEASTNTLPISVAV